MTKRTRKARAKSAARKSKGEEPWRRAVAKGKVGGFREGSGPKPKLGEGHEREVIKTVRLSTAEHESQLAAVKRSGAKNWAEWARGLLNLEAGESARAEMLASVQQQPTSAEVETPTQLVVPSEDGPDRVFGLRPLGAVVTGTDHCACGHAPEEHGRDPAHPGSTACRADLGAGGCDCAAYEAEPGAGLYPEGG